MSAKPHSRRRRVVMVSPEGESGGQV
jgi:hypothetical protein